MAAGSKLLPGATVGIPQGLEAIELSSHLERMQLEREERQKRILAAENYRKKHEEEVVDKTKARCEKDQAPGQAPVIFAVLPKLLNRSVCANITLTHIHF